MAAINYKEQALQYYLLFENNAACVTPSFIPTHVATLSDSVLQEEVIWRKATHQILVKKFFYLMKLAECDSFVEIGAFDGSISLNVEAIGLNNIVAFEANPYTYEKFKSNFQNTNIKYLNIGVSSGEETLELKIPKHAESLELPNSSILQRAENSEFTEVKVMCIGLDQIVDYLPNPINRGALWIDLEGLAFEVLSASNNFLHNIELIFVEVEDFQYWKNQKFVIDIYELLLSKGFVPLIRDFEGRGQYNIIFVKKTNTYYYNALVSEYLLELKRLTHKGQYNQNIIKRLLNRIRLTKK